MSRSEPAPISLRLLIAITACWVLAQMGYYAQAQLFGPVMERYALDESIIGLMMSQEMVAYALTALLMAGPVTRLPRALIALCGGVIVLGSNLVSGFTDSFELLRVMRITTGFGAGMIGAAGTAAAASSINPQRVFAIISVSWGLVAAGNNVILPYLTVPYGAMGGYFGMAAAVVILCPLFFWLPPPPEEDTDHTLSPVAWQQLSLLQRAAEKLGVRDAPNKEYALIAMAALFIYEIGQGSTQVFLEQFGLRAGLDEYRIGQVLGIAGFLGLFGGVIAAWVSDRFGNLKPALLGIATNAITAATMALGTSAFAFGALYLGWNICFYFVVPYILGIMSEMDTRGRWAVATDAVWWFGAAPGAAVGGYLVTSMGYTGVALLPVVVGSISMVMFGVTLGRFYAKQTHSPHAEDSPT